MTDTAVSEQSSALLEAIKFGATLAHPMHADVGEYGQKPYVVLPEGYTVKDVESTLANPTRKRGKATLSDTASFIAYFMRHAAPNESAIYGNFDPPSFTAVLDDHSTDGTAGWREHVAKYACPLSVEWATWTGANKVKMKQVDFAQFIEDNLPDIVEPAAAHMLEVSRTLEAKKAVNFASGVRLANGEVQFTYEEKVDGSAGKGQFHVPEIFSIGIPVFQRGVRYRIEARLRYRIAEGGQLAMWFDLVRHHKVLEDAVVETWAEIEAKTGQTIFNGAPGV